MTDQLQQSAQELDTALQALFALVGHTPAEARENVDLFMKRAMVRGMTPLIAEHEQADQVLDRLQLVNTMDEIQAVLTEYFEPTMISENVQQGLQEELHEYLDEVMPELTQEQQMSIAKLFLHLQPQQGV